MFLIKERVGAGEITIKHCPTTNGTLAHHFTKLEANFAS
jgi:hypothetical protein